MVELMLWPLFSCRLSATIHRSHHFYQFLRPVPMRIDSPRNLHFSTARLENLTVLIARDTLSKSYLDSLTAALLLLGHNQYPLSRGHSVAAVPVVPPPRLLPFRSFELSRRHILVSTNQAVLAPGCPIPHGLDGFCSIPVYHCYHRDAATSH